MCDRLKLVYKHDERKKKRDFGNHCIWHQHIGTADGGNAADVDMKY